MVNLSNNPSIVNMADRDGYNPDFLGVRVQLPGMTDEMLENLSFIEGRDDGQLKYTHYSLFMNQKTSQR